MSIRMYVQRAYLPVLILTLKAEAAVDGRMNAEGLGGGYKSRERKGGVNGVKERE
jgi:hypothetical protein